MHIQQALNYRVAYVNNQGQLLSNKFSTASLDDIEGLTKLAKVKSGELAILQLTHAGLQAMP